ncbi:MAG: LysM peptidoglycan-binding domain-containing protein [Lachnospiraceae bacterium]|nr:LysM peptidoglycan-binding domain-containing protein [Lachnospiraceae bacterium]
MAETGYDFYLDKCLLPVAPGKLDIKINNANKTVTLINEGEVNMLKQAKLTEIEFECGIPQANYPFAVYKAGFREADYFLNYFEQLKSSRKPFQFIVCRQRPDGRKLFNTNMKVSLEDYRITEEASDGFDLAVKVKLKQWRDYGTKTVKITLSSSRPKASAVSARAASPPSAQAYTVVKGDCLWKIAKRFYGSGSRYTVIYDANKDIIESTARKYGKADSNHGHWIYPGTVLNIPAA